MTLVRARRAAYRLAMPRLLRLVAMLALMLMPIGLVPGGHMAAHAAPSAMAAHCADMDAKPHGQPGDRQPDRSADCAIACSAVPSVASALPAPPLAPAMLHPLPLAPIHGLAPEAATPPPRFS